VYTLTIPAAAVKNMAGAVMREDYIYSFSAVSTDVNNDGATNLKDLELVSSKYNTQEGQSTWNPSFDLNDDGVVDIFDLVTIAILAE
jgi:hypothetical protein